MSGSLDLGTSRREGLTTRQRSTHDEPETEVGAEGGVVNEGNNDAEDSGSESTDLSSILAYLIRRYIEVYISWGTKCSLGNHLI